MNKLSNYTPILKDYIGIFFPILISMMATFLLQIIDTLFISTLGEAALAGVGLAISLTLIVPIIISGVASAASVNISRAFGAKLYERTKIKTLLSFILGTLFSISYFILAYIYSDFTLSIFNSDNKEVFSFAGEYYKIWIYLIPLLGAQVLAHSLSATNQNKLMAKINLLTLFLNVIFNYFLIFGVENILPAMGVAGAAWGTVLATLVNFLILIYIFTQKGIFRPSVYDNFHKLVILSKKILNLTGHFILINITFPIILIITASIVSNFPVEYTSAFALLSRFEMLFMMIALTVTITINILMSKYDGEKRLDKGLVLFNLSMYIISIWAFIIFLIIMFLGEDIGAFFLKSSKSIDIFYWSWVIGLTGLFGSFVMTNIVRTFSSLKMPKYGTYLFIIRSIFLAIIPFYIAKYFGYFAFISSIQIIVIFFMLISIYLFYIKKNILFKLN